LRQMQTELNKVMDAIKAISFIKDWYLRFELNIN
jgi:hypothetical protein